MLSGPVFGFGDCFGSSTALKRSNGVFLIGAWFAVSKRGEPHFPLVNTYFEKNLKSHLGLPKLRWQDLWLIGVSMLLVALDPFPYHSMGCLSW
jgi:hypothetical protein